MKRPSKPRFTSSISLLLPKECSNFHLLRQKGKIYIDKTQYVYQLAANPTGKYFLLRPGKFGKSLLCTTFESLFKNEKEDFKGLYIENKWINSEHIVVRIDLSQICDFEDSQSFLFLFLQHLRLAILRGNDGTEEPQPFTSLFSFYSWLRKVSLCQVALIVDDYDAPLRASLGNQKLFIEVSRILNQFFSIVKSEDRAFGFVFITGQTNYSDANIFDGINNLQNLSTSSQDGSILGFTAEELRLYLNPYLERASKVLGLSIQEVLEEMQRHYGGYCFDNGCSQKLFSPASTLKFLAKPWHGFKNYWKESSSYTGRFSKFYLL